jgi:hypothetical protein
MLGQHRNKKFWMEGYGAVKLWHTPILTAPHLISKPTSHNLSLQCLASSNLVAKVERFACIIPHTGNMAFYAGTLKDGYVHKVTMPRAPLIQHTSHVTGNPETDTCYSQVPRIHTWSNQSRSLAVSGGSIVQPFLFLALVSVAH